MANNGSGRFGCDVGKVVRNMGGKYLRKLKESKMIAKPVVKKKTKSTRTWLSRNYCTYRDCDGGDGWVVSSGWAELT